MKSSKEKGRHVRSRINSLADHRRPQDLDNQLWVHRTVSKKSTADLLEVEKLLYPYASAKIGNYTLTLLYQSEILAANRASGHGFITERRLSGRISPFLPVSFWEPIEVNIEGLDQYGAWIGAVVSSPEIETEREALLTGLDSVFGVESVRDNYSHISIANGNLARVRNVQEILGVLPTKMMLSPGDGLFIND